MKELNNPVIAREYVEKNYIHLDELKKIFCLEENCSKERILNLIQVVIEENNRLENIEDEKIEVDYNHVYMKAVNDYKEKIREIIEELKNKPYGDVEFYRIKYAINVLSELLKWR